MTAVQTAALCVCSHEETIIIRCVESKAVNPLFIKER